MATRTPARKAKRPTRPKRPVKKKATTRAKFGRSGTAGKADGRGAIRAWMAGVNPAHRPIVEKLDALILETVPDVKCAIKWSTPMYGRSGHGWFAHIAAYRNHVSLGFFVGVKLDPPPPKGKSKQMRRVDLEAMSDFDETQFRSWIQQAAAMKGWGKA